MLTMPKIEHDDGDNLTSKITPFEDDFMDGNYTSPTWTVASGTWSASNAYLDATVAGTAEIHTAVSSSDLEGWFSYKMGDTSMGSNCLLVRFRYLSGGSEQTYLRIFRNQMMIQERYDDEWITLATNASASSTEDVWYDIYIKADGEDIEVWQGPKGGTMTEVFSTGSSQVEYAQRFAFVQYVGGDFQIDNVRIADGSKSTSTSMSHDDNNQLDSTAVNNVTTTFKYDVLGRTISKYNAYHDATYVYRYDDKLYQVTSDFPGEQNVSFDYDGLGKLREWDNGTDYAWLRWDAGWNLLNLATDEIEDEEESEYWRDAVKTYVGRNAEFTGSNPATGTWEYQTHDNLGSVRGKWDANKASVGTHQYTPYGNMYAYTGTAIGNTDRGYTGHMRSNESNLYFAPYRFYSPQSARWMKLDPLGMADGPNMYGYVSANPTNAADPYGLYGYVCPIKPDGTLGKCKRIGWWKRRGLNNCAATFIWDQMSCYYDMIGKPLPSTPHNVPSPRVLSDLSARRQNVEGEFLPDGVSISCSMIAKFTICMTEAHRDHLDCTMDVLGF